LVPEFGHVSFDVAFGGAVYAIVDAESLQTGFTTRDFKEIVNFGRRIKQAILQHLETQHSHEPGLGALFGVLFTGPAQNASCHSRLGNVFGDGIVGRSATGTGGECFCGTAVC
jgi:proline racemase